MPLGGLASTHPVDRRDHLHSPAEIFGPVVDFAFKPPSAQLETGASAGKFMPTAITAASTATAFFLAISFPHADSARATELNQWRFNPHLSKPIAMVDRREHGLEWLPLMTRIGSGTAASVRVGGAVLPHSFAAALPLPDCGLLSYGMDLAALYRLTGLYAGKILKDQLADLHVQQPTSSRIEFRHNRLAGMRLAEDNGP